MVQRPGWATASLLREMSGIHCFKVQSLRSFRSVSTCQLSYCLQWGMLWLLENAIVWSLGIIDLQQISYLTLLPGNIYIYFLTILNFNIRQQLNTWCTSLVSCTILKSWVLYQFLTSPCPLSWWNHIAALNRTCQVSSQIHSNSWKNN